jgi:hypothetical protein
MFDVSTILPADALIRQAWELHRKGDDHKQQMIIAGSTEASDREQALFFAFARGWLIGHRYGIEAPSDLRPSGPAHFPSPTWANTGD